MLVKCDICDKSFPKKGISTHKNRSHGSSEIQAKYKRKRSREQILIDCENARKSLRKMYIAQWVELILTCKKCGKPFPFLKKGNKIPLHCSRSCSNLGNATGGKTKETPCIKCGKQLLVGKRANPSKILCDGCKPVVEIKILNCLDCGSILDSGRLCKSCIKVRLSSGGKIGGKISASLQLRRSKDEIHLFELCKTKWFCEANKIIADGWDSDITIKELNLLVFWNGIWHYEQTTLKNHSLKQVQTRDKIKTNLFKSLGWNILVFEERTDTPKSAFEKIKNFALYGLCGMTPVS